MSNDGATQRLAAPQVEPRLANEGQVLPGQILAGKYRVDHVLGVGGMGVVVAAHHLQLDTPVALKFLLPAWLNNADGVARFAREARAAAKIRSEHVARVMDVGTLENGAPYMVMEYLVGCDLGAWLKQRGQLPVEEAVEFLLQASEALAEAHCSGIVHRDLKPSNLFVVQRADGTHAIKVLDFGISKMAELGADEGNVTQTSAVMGSPLYMSPEQLRSSKAADARSDIWSLGVILYELLSGASPFVADSFTELVLKTAGEPPAPLRAARPQAPEKLELVVLKCLEKDRAQRYQNVGELALALAPFAPARAQGSVSRISRVLEAVGISSLPPAELPTLVVDGGTDVSWGRTSARSHRNSLFGLGVIGVLLLGVGAWFVASHSGTRAPAAGSTAAGAPLAMTQSAVAPTPATQRVPEATTVRSPEPVVSIAPANVASVPPRLTRPATTSRMASPVRAPAGAVKPTPAAATPNVRSLIDDRQ